MNLSVLTVAACDDALIAQRAQFMRDNADRRVRVKFVKKDGSLREMVCIPRMEYNEEMGIPTTDRGRAIVAAKTAKKMVVVSEICSADEEHPAEWMRPRTITLAKLIEMSLD